MLSYGCVAALNFLLSDKSAVVLSALKVFPGGKAGGKPGYTSQRLYLSLKYLT